MTINEKQWNEILPSSSLSGGLEDQNSKAQPIAKQAVGAQAIGSLATGALALGPPSLVRWPLVGSL